MGAIFTNGDPAGEASNQLGGVNLELTTSSFMGRGKNLSLMLFGSQTRTSVVEGVELPAGVYEFSRHAVSAMTSEGRPLSARVELATGWFFSGTRRSASVSPRGWPALSVSRGRVGDLDGLPAPAPG